MSDYMPAEIWIGGRVPATLAPQLCEQISSQGASLEWGGGSFTPSEARELLEACEDDDGVRLLRLYDDQARGGQFEALETFLQEHEIAFSRRSDGKYEYDPEVVESRPGRAPVYWTTDHGGNPTVQVAGLLEIEQMLGHAIQQLSDGMASRALAELRTAAERFRQQLPPSVPPLEPFEIVG